MNKLKSIVYISLPEGMDRRIGSLSLNPGILLPVEVPEGIEPAEWDSSGLSWEMIISGMLKIMAYDPEHKDIPYYREFIKAVRPEIQVELTQSAVIKTQSGDFDLAREIFLALISYDKKDLRSRLNLVLLNENRFNAGGMQDISTLKAEIGSQYDELLNSGEDLPDIYFNAAWFYYKIQDFSRAFELCDAYLSMGKDDIKRSEAEKLRRECSDLKGMNEEYREAFSLITADRNEEGLELISSFLENGDEIWNAWFLKGWALRKLSRFEEALEAFKKANALHPSQLDVLNELAICSLEMMDYRVCRKYLEEALALDPESLKVISNMGILCLKEEKFEEAAAFFRTVLALEPEDPIALEYLNFLENRELP